MFDPHVSQAIETLVIGVGQEPKGIAETQWSLPADLRFKG